VNELPKWLIHYLYKQLNFLAIFAPLREQMPFLIWLSVVKKIKSSLFAFLSGYAAFIFSRAYAEPEPV